MKSTVTTTIKRISKNTLLWSPIVAISALLTLIVFTPYFVSVWIVCYVHEMNGTSVLALAPILLIGAVLSLLILSMFSKVEGLANSLRQLS
jgi:hypothetical protein